MGFRGAAQPTRVDLAILAKCTSVMSLDCVEAFMDAMWAKPIAARDGARSSVSPRAKCMLHIAAHGPDPPGALKHP